MTKIDANKKGQGDIEKIIASVFSLFFIIIFFSALIPLFNSLGNTHQNEINNLNNQISTLNQKLSEKEIQISQLQSIINSVNNTITQKDQTISNLTGQLKQKKMVIKNLTNELSYLQEKRYLQEINNNYYNISNQFQKIENQFFPISISISLISVTLIALIIKEFTLIQFFKRLLKKLFRKRDKKEELLKLPNLEQNEN